MCHRSSDTHFNQTEVAARIRNGSNPSFQWDNRDQKDVCHIASPGDTFIVPVQSLIGAVRTETRPQGTSEDEHDIAPNGTTLMAYDNLAFAERPDATLKMRTETRPRGTSEDGYNIASNGTALMAYDNLAFAERPDASLKAYDNLAFVERPDELP